LLPHLVFATPQVGYKTQKGRKAYSSTSKQLISHDALFALYKTRMSNTFPQESFEAFFNLKKSALPRTKKTFTNVF